MVLNAYSLILPISAFVFDCDYRRVYRKAELKVIIFLKVVLWVIFYGIYIAAVVQR